MSRLIVALVDTTVDRMQAGMAQAFEHGADMVELRLDYLNDAAGIEQLMPLLDRPEPKILTLRSTGDGGRSDLGASDRVDILIDASRCRPEYIDFEYRDYLRSAALRQRIGLAAGCGTSAALILSHHDFRSRPDRLFSLVQEMQSQPGCDVVKLAWMPNSICDNFDAFEIVSAAHKPTMAICMGEEGLLSRVLAPKFGAFGSFCALDGHVRSAPGQLTLEQAKKLYRWDTINAETAWYGLIGYPVCHSIGPQVHNAVFDALEFNAVYVPLLVDPTYDHFADFVRGCMEREWLDAKGFSVTMPHKQHALEFVGSAADPLAKRIGAVNTLILEAGAIRGLNTDYVGVIDAVTRSLEMTRKELEGLPVAVLGAGGVARAVVAALTDCGCAVTIFSRTPEQGEALANQFDARSMPWKLRTQHVTEGLLVNCTNLGMAPRPDETPWPQEAHNEKVVVFDTVYNPIETQLLRDAREAGCRTVRGVEMFVHQAAAQFEAWTLVPAPRDLMLRVALEALAPKPKTARTE